MQIFCSLSQRTVQLGQSLVKPKLHIISFWSTISICSHLHSSMTVQLNLWLLGGLGSQEINTVDQVFSSQAACLLLFLQAFRSLRKRESSFFTLPLSSVDTVWPFQHCKTTSGMCLGNDHYCRSGSFQQWDDRWARSMGNPNSFHFPG